MKKQNLPQETRESPSIAPLSIPSEVAELVDEMMNLACDAEPFEIDEYCARHPDWADQLRNIFPAMMALAARASGPHAGIHQDNRFSHLSDLHGVLGDFEILREIGRGGMGIVYEAEQLSLKRRVALKVLPFAALLDKRRLIRFQNEARAAAMLKHPNIVSVFSVGSDRGVHFFAMELVEGRTLADVILDRIRRSANQTQQRSEGDSCSELTLETLPLARYSTDASTRRMGIFAAIASIGQQAAEALQYAHEEGVTHRDIKPSNLMIDESGKLHVTDFGLALIESGDHVTHTGDLVGTLRYMSPEQIEGAMVDRRTDVYSLGLTLYELCTGQPAFEGKNRNDLMQRIVECEPTKPSQVANKIPRDLETIILKSISKNPSHRYSSARHMAEDLERFLETRPVQARKPGALEIARRWVERNPVVAMLMCATGCLAAVLLAVTSYAAWSLSKEAAIKERILYARDMRVAQSAVKDADFISAEQILKQWAIPGRAALRNFEWFYLWQACHPASIKKTIAYEVPTFSVNFLGTDKRLAVGHFMHKIDVWDIDSQEQPQLTNSLRAYGMANFNSEFISGDNVLVTSNRKGLVKEWDVVNWKLLGTIDPQLPPSIRETPHLAVSPNGDLLAITTCVNDVGTVKVWDRRSGSWLGDVPNLNGDPRVVFVSETKIAIATAAEPRLAVIDIQNWRTTREIALQSDGIMNIAVSPKTNTFLATAGIESHGARLSGRIEFVDCDSDRPRSSLALGHSHIQKLTFSSNGEYLAAGTESGFVYVIETANRRVLAKQKLHMGAVYGLAFSQTDKYLASASSDNRVRVYDLETLLRPEPSDVTYPGLYKSGRSVFVNNEVAMTAESSCDVRFWDVRTGQTIVHHDDSQLPYNIAHAAASPHGVACATMGCWPPNKRPGIVKVFDTSTFEEIATIEVPGGLSYCAPSISRDGLFAVGGMQSVVIVDTKSKRILKTLSDIGWAKGVSFSQDGRALACAMADSVVRIYEVPSFRERLSPIDTGADTCEHASFSPDGKLIAVVDIDRDNCIKLYDASSGQFLRRFTSLPNFQLMTEFSPDGKRLVSSGNSGKIRVWDVESGEPMISFDVAPGHWPSCDFSPNGKSIVASGGYFAKVFHSADPEAIGELTVSELNEVACRTLTTVDD